MARRYATVWLPVALTLAAAAAGVVFVSIAFTPTQTAREVPDKLTLFQGHSLAANAEGMEDRPEGSATYEVLHLDLGAADSGAPAPCDGCLNEAGAIDVGWEYLRDNGYARHIGDLRAELIEDFPWRGTDGLRYRRVPKTLGWQEMLAEARIWPLPEVEYVAEGGAGPGAGESEPAEDLTWRVWYRLRWVGVREIEAMIDADMLPLEALSWPPQKEEEFLLVHARTRTVIAPHMLRIDYAGARGDES